MDRFIGKRVKSKISGRYAKVERTGKTIVSVRYEDNGRLGYEDYGTEASFLRVYEIVGESVEQGTDYPYDGLYYKSLRRSKILLIKDKQLGWYGVYRDGKFAGRTCNKDVETYISLGTWIRCDETHATAPTTQEKRKCTCDFYEVIMRTGCKCGGE